MAGTKIGGQRAAAKNLAKDPDFYKKIGKIGGANSKTGGFYGDKTRAAIIGKVGGSRSKRGHKYQYTKNGYNYYIALETGNVVKYKHEDKFEK